MTCLIHDEGVNPELDIRRDGRDGWMVSQFALTMSTDKEGAVTSTVTAVLECGCIIQAQIDDSQFEVVSSWLGEMV